MLTVLGNNQEAREAVRLARAALGRELGVPPMSLAVGEVIPWEWPDAGLGCPRKGIGYAQVVTTGFRVVLGLSGRSYEMHVGGGAAVLCDAAASTAKQPPERFREAARLAESARGDLAQRLRIDKADVRVDLIRPAEKSRAACETTEEASEPRPVQRFQIELTAKGRRYSYYAAGRRLVLCTKLPGERPSTAK